MLFCYFIERRCSPRSGSEWPRKHSKTGRLWSLLVSSCRADVFKGTRKHNFIVNILQHLFQTLPTPLSFFICKIWKYCTCRTRYSYPVVARVRRGTFADILKALSFELVLPKVDWKKVIGSSKIGASFGIFMENYIKLKLGSYISSFETCFFGQFETPLLFPVCYFI